MATSGLYGPPTRVPAIPDSRSAKPEDVAAAVKEWIEVREGVRGDGMDKAVTLRDLLNANLATPLDLRNLAPGMANLPGGGVGSPSQEPAIPPTPENLVAAGAFRYVILTWDFTRGYSRLAYFEVWRSPTNVIGDAVLIAQPYSTIYADDVGPGQSNYYWVRAVSNAPAMSPYSSLTGTLGATELDPAYIIDAIQGQIGTSALNDELGGRVSLIDGPASLDGSVSNRIAASYAAVTNYTYSRQTIDSALAQVVQQVNSTVGGYTAAIEANTQSINGIKLQYTMKLDNNGYVAGIGVSSDLLPGGNGAYSQIIMRADSFSIGSPSGPGIPPSIPFIVRTTTSVINGVTVPIGVYIQDAMIANGSIGNAKIGNLQVDDAKIANMSVAKLRAGAIVASEYIQSSNYVGGSTGFLIHGNGYAEFQNGTFRGAIYATSGLIGGNVLADRSITTSKLLVGNADQVLPDSNMMDHFFWGRSDDPFIAYPGTFWKSTRVLTLGIRGYEDIATPFFPVEKGGTYKFDVQIFTSGNYQGQLTVVAHLPNQEWCYMGCPQLGYTNGSSGLPVSFDGGNHQGGTPFTATRTINTDDAAGRTQIRIISNVVVGYVQIGGIKITRVMDSVLIQDGAVIAGKVAAKAIKAENIDVLQLSAVSRDVGVLDGGVTNGQRTVITSSGVDVYDQNNTRLVQLGIY